MRIPRVLEVRRAFAEPIGASETIARYIGKLVAQLSQGRMRELQVEFSGTFPRDPDPVAVAAIDDRGPLDQCDGGDIVLRGLLLPDPRAAAPAPGPANPALLRLLFSDDVSDVADLAIDVLARTELGGTSQVTVVGHLDAQVLERVRRAGLEVGPVALQDLFVHLTDGRGEPGSAQTTTGKTTAAATAAATTTTTEEVDR